MIILIRNPSERLSLRNEPPGGKLNQNSSQPYKIVRLDEENVSQSYVGAIPRFAILTITNLMEVILC